MRSDTLQVRGPAGDEAQVLPLELDETLRDTMATVLVEARDAAAAVPGALVEDNRYSVSVHFRNCASCDYARVRLRWRSRARRCRSACPSSEEQGPKQGFDRNP